MPIGAAKILCGCLAGMRVWRLAVCKLRLGLAVPIGGAKILCGCFAGMRVWRLAVWELRLG